MKATKYERLALGALAKLGSHYSLRQLRAKLKKIAKAMA
jgi:hypothetical protein